MVRRGLRLWFLFSLVALYAAGYANVRAGSPIGTAICAILPSRINCVPGQAQPIPIPVELTAPAQCPESNRRFEVTIAGANTVIVCDGRREWRSLIVKEGATLTQSQIQDNAAPESNLLFIETEFDIEVKTGGKIDLSGKGYRGGVPLRHHNISQTTPFAGSPSYKFDPAWQWFVEGDGYGPAWGVNVGHVGNDRGTCRGEIDGGGGGHGGRGGRPSISANSSIVQRPAVQFERRAPYGDPTAPVTVGSGGGSTVFHERGGALSGCSQHQDVGFAGGGALHLKGRRVRITADQGSGVFANGNGSGSRAGGGAGGSIWIESQESAGAAAQISVAGGTGILANNGEDGSAPAGNQIPLIGGGKVEAKGGSAGSGGGGGRIRLNLYSLEPPGTTGATGTGTGTGTTGGPPAAAAVWKIVDTLPSQSGSLQVEDLRDVTLDGVAFTNFTLSGTDLTFNNLPTSGSGTKSLGFKVTVKSEVNCSPSTNLLSDIARLFKDAVEQALSRKDVAVACLDIVLSGDIRSGGTISGVGKRLELPIGILEAVGDIEGLSGVKNLPNYVIGNDSILFWDPSNSVRNKELEKNLKRLEGERAKPWDVSNFSGGNLFFETNQATPDQACTIPTGCNPPTDGQVWRVPGNLTVAPTGGTLTLKGRGTLIVRGDLTVRGNLVYQGSEDSIGWIVLGNIYFVP